MTDLTTVEGLIAWRKSRWAGDIRDDNRAIAYIAKRIVDSPSARRTVRDKPYLLIEAVMQVVDKHMQVVPFFLNSVQRAFLDAFERHGTSRPYFVLKGRQQGFTTLITAMQLCYCLSRRHFAGFTLADNMENMNAIFSDKAKAMYDRLPTTIKPSTKYNSRRELVFGRLGSSWRVGAAGDNLGRSRTLHFVHYSEVAFYRCRLDSLQRSLGEALTADSVQIYETTANGWNAAKELWDRGTCVNLFFPWWQSPEYATDREPINLSDAWLEGRLRWLEAQGIDRRQRNWYAAKYAGYLDKSGIMQEYPSTAEEAWVASTDCYFDRESVLAALNSAQGADRCGYFDCHLMHTDVGEEYVTDIRWVDDPAGCIRLHALPLSRTERGQTLYAPYALGGDTAGEGSDYYAAKVVNAETAETVATLHVRHTDDDLYARQVYCLGWYYNHATIGIEVNFSMQPTRLLQRWGYPNLYMRERPDLVTGGRTLRAGFVTNAQTRPVMLSALKAIWRDNPTVERDKDTLLEMLSFVRNGAGRPEAMAGKHDDLVMSLAIAHQVAERTPREWTEQGEDEPDWIALHFRMDDEQ